MKEATDTMKMMSDGFELLAKGFAEMVKRLETANVPATPAEAMGDADTCTVTLPEAAKRLGISRSQVDRLCKAGELEYTMDRRTGYRRVTTAGIVAYHRRLHENAKRMKEAA